MIDWEQIIEIERLPDQVGEPTEYRARLISRPTAARIGRSREEALGKVLMAFAPLALADALNDQFFPVPPLQSLYINAFERCTAEFQMLPGGDWILIIRWIGSNNMAQKAHMSIGGRSLGREEVHQNIFIFLSSKIPQQTAAIWAWLRPIIYDLSNRALPPEA